MRYVIDKEISLRVSILEQGISDFLYARPEGVRSIQHAEKIREQLSITWIFGSEQNYPFGFEALCDVVSLDPSQVRTELINEVLNDYDW